MYQDYQFSESWLYCSEFSISPLVESWRLSLKPPGCNALLLSFQRAKASLAQGFLWLGATKITKTYKHHFSPEWSESWHRQSNRGDGCPAGRCIRTRTVPESSWNRLKWRVVFFAFLTVLMCMHYIHVSKKMTNDPWSHQSINPADWGVFFGLPKKMGCGLQVMALACVQLDAWRIGHVPFFCCRRCRCAFMDDRHPGSGVTKMVQKQKSTMSDPLMNYKLYLL